MNALRDYLDGLSINVKLAFGMGAMCLIILVIGAQSVYLARVQSEELRRMSDLELQGISNIKSANISLMEIGRSLRQMVLASDADARAHARSAGRNPRREEPHVVQAGQRRQLGHHLRSALRTGPRSDESHSRSGSCRRI